LHRTAEHIQYFLRSGESYSLELAALEGAANQPDGTNDELALRLQFPKQTFRLTFKYAMGHGDAVDQDCHSRTVNRAVCHGPAAYDLGGALQKIHEPK